MPRSSPSSHAGQFFLMLVLVCAIAGGGAWWFLQQKKNRLKIAAELASEPDPIPASKPAPAPLPEPAPPSKPEPPNTPKLAPAPAPTPEPEPAPKPMSEPEPAPEPEPELAAEKKSDLDLLLEQTYPMPDFKPLLELVDHWNRVPERAFPKQITVNAPLEYQLSASGKIIGKTRLEAGHSATPLKFKPGSLLVKSPGAPNMQAVVAIDDTDFKRQVESLYEQKVADSRARILAQREKMRDEVAQSLVQAEKEPETPVTRTPLTSEVASNYGRQFRGDYMPEVKNGKGDPPDHEIPLGPVGGKAAAMFDKEEAVVAELWENGPGAKSGLKVGDVIVKANGRSFKTYTRGKSDDPTGAPEDLGMAMVEAQATGRALELTVLREGTEELLKLELPALPAFADTYPANCARSAALIEASAQWLADNQKDDGFWRSNPYSSAWCALSLLATGDPRYKQQIKKAARAFAEQFEMGDEPTREELLAPMGGLDNWKQCMTGIFLGEYLLATGDETVEKALLDCCRRMEARLQPETGRLGHSSDKLPYGGKGLVIINVHAHLMWALAANVNGLEWNWEPWDLSYRAIDASIRDGAVGYNFSAKGGGQSGSRTGSMATALILSDHNASNAREMGAWMKENHRMFPNTHAMTSLGVIFGVMGLKNTSKSGYRKCLDNFRWMFSLVQPANFDHGSYYYGHRGNHGGDGYCKRRLVGNFTTLMVLCSARDDSLWMFGNRKRGWYQ